MVLDKKIFHVFPYMSLCKIYDPWDGPRPTLNKLDSSPLGDAMHTKRQGPRQRRYFHAFLYISLCKNVTPERGYFLPQEHNLNKHGRGLLGDAAYHLSRLYALWFETRRFFHIFPYISQCKICNPRGEASFGPMDII